MVKHDSGSSVWRESWFQRHSRSILPVAIFGITFGLYIKTMATSVFWGDSASLAAGNFILGIPHSPSYPLYTLLGRLFGLIPGLEPAFSANLMSAFFAALSVMLFFLLVRRFVEVPAFQMGDYRKVMQDRKLLLRRPDLKRDDRLFDIEEASQAPAMVLLPAVMVTLLYAISLPVWLAAVRAEVYSLHLFMSFLAMVLCFNGTDVKQSKSFFLGIWVYALSFANHPLLALAFFPAFLYLMIRQIVMVGFKWSAALVFGLLFIASFSVYMYLPVRSGLDPAINWGNPESMESFWTALTRSAVFPGFVDSATIQDYLIRLRKVGQFAAGQIGWPLIVLTLAGFWGFFKISRRFFPFVLLALLANFALVLWAADFSIKNYDVVSHLAPLFGLVLLISVTGVLYIMRRKILANHAALYMTAFLAVFIYVSGESNYVRANLSRIDGPNLICQEIGKAVPDGSLLIVTDDDLLLPIWYYAYADSTASGIKVIAAETMANPDYRRQVSVNYPELTYPPEFAGNEPGDPAKLTEAICRLNCRANDIYLQVGVPGIPFSKMLPRGIVFKYMDQGNLTGVPNDLYKRHLYLADLMLPENSSEPKTIDFLGRWLFNAGVYCDRMGNHDHAWQLFTTALTIDRDNVDMRIRLASNLDRAGRYREALKFISEALEIDPYDPYALKLGQAIARKVNDHQEGIADE
ncbi:MAG: DUF2723 domain-containing protein [candidate division Zixibacteria bacterium]|nr:DUF2723 domain-containing protein [candidate division Zixibacteria bacterium]